MLAHLKNNKWYNLKTRRLESGNHWIEKMWNKVFWIRNKATPSDYCLQTVLHFFKSSIFSCCVWLVRCCRILCYWKEFCNRNHTKCRGMSNLEFQRDILYHYCPGHYAQSWTCQIVHLNFNVIFGQCLMDIPMNVEQPKIRGEWMQRIKVSQITFIFDPVCNLQALAKTFSLSFFELFFLINLSLANIFNLSLAAIIFLLLKFEQSGFQQTMEWVMELQSGECLILREGHQKNKRFYLGLSPKQRTPPTHPPLRFRTFRKLTGLPNFHDKK